MDAAMWCGLYIAQHGGLDAAEAEEESWLVRVLAGSVRFVSQMCFGFDLREGEGYGQGVAVGGEVVDPGAAGVAEAEQFGDLVKGLAGRVVRRCGQTLR